MCLEECVPSASKPRAVILLLVSAGLTVLVAAGLPLLTVQPAMPLPSFEGGEVSVPSPTFAPVGMTINRLAGIIVLMILGVFILVLIIRAMRGVPWKRLLPAALSLLWKVLLVCGLLLLVLSLLPRTAGTSAGEPMPPPKPLATSPLGPVPPAVIWAAGIVLATAVILLAVRMLVARRRRDSRPWEREVEHARQALLEGQDLREVIIRCYRRMGEGLQEARGIEREAFMTTGEFEELLTEEGLPRDPVRRLTRLFEAVRYSLRQPAPGEEQNAILCLDAILEHCRQPRGTDAGRAG
jgi:hypothetical protein